MPPHLLTKSHSQCSHDDLVSNIPLELLEREAHAVLHAHLVAHGAVLAQDGNALHLDPILHNARRMCASWDRSAFDTSPCTDSRAPTHNRVQNARVVLDLGVL